jgi:hypothetical protein
MYIIRSNSINNEVQNNGVHRSIEIRSEFTLANRTHGVSPLCMASVWINDLFSSFGKHREAPPKSMVERGFVCRQRS